MAEERIRSEYFKNLRAERDTAQADLKALLDAVEQALNVLGTGECSVNTCEGCAAETHEAIWLLRDATASRISAGKQALEGER